MFGILPRGFEIIVGALVNKGGKVCVLKQGDKVPAALASLILPLVCWFSSVPSGSCANSNTLGRALATFCCRIGPCLA